MVMMTTPENNAPSVIQKQPLWQLPEGFQPPLTLLNTLTHSKVPFVPLQENVIRWYSCGPTVYDAAHIGHARNYVTFDILRRLLSNYFGYDVTYVMNITDIDDKIILRARQAHLVKKFSEEKPLLQDSKETVALAVQEYALSKLKLDLNMASVEEALDIVSKVDLTGDEDGKLNMAKETVTKSLKVLSQDPSTTSTELFSDILAAHLDRTSGHTVSDQKVFKDLAVYWERDFMEDMQSLGVLPANFVTRVSEYIPEVIAHVQQIMAKGFGYEAEGSVYFDVRAFEAAGHPYARLCPASGSQASAKLIEEGEGALGIKLSGKRDPRDFALWKAGKAGEPTWSSPWGPGRPGWHIECSAMASAVLPGRLDIHSGGIDLAFPHHDNELAQAEAHSHQPLSENAQSQCRQHLPWVNYFLHAGHVHIAGFKMSKSLKNFISIKEALKRYTPRQLRVLFVQHAWHAPMSFKDSAMEAAASADATIRNFFATCVAFLRQQASSSSKDEIEVEEVNNASGIILKERKFGKVESVLLTVLQETQSRVHASLSDSLDTPTAFTALLELIARTNVYFATGECRETLSIIARYIARILQSMGLFYEDAQLVMQSGIAQTSSADVVDKWQLMGPALTSFSAFRDTVRQAAIRKDESLREVILKACDIVRSDLAKNAGVALEDKSDGQPATIKLVNQDDFEEPAVDEAALARKLSLLRIQEEKEREKAARAAITPQDLFRPPHVPEGLYSVWDERGIPTHDAQSTPLSKNASKRVVKEYETHLELLAKYNTRH